MKFSLAWLQEYSKEPFPKLHDLADTVTLNAFEIEDIEELAHDTVLDVKILPNRAHDALGHRGLARDICALVGSTFEDPQEYYEGEGDGSVLLPGIKIEDTKACTRFMGVRIDGVQVADSPDWLKAKLNAIGQKSINSIVDITNYVQFAINKPMHAYDANLIAGNELHARCAVARETLLTLDDKTLELDDKTLVIADAEKPLGLAGIKGGKFSGISASTTSIILESANFNPTLIRKTSQKYGIRTDASKRFENEISDELVEEGLRMTVALIKKLNPNANISAIVDVNNRKPWQYTVSISIKEVNDHLGTSYSEEEVRDVYSKLGFSVRVATTREIIEEQIKKAEGAVYKNPSSMRQDAPEAFSCSSFISFLYMGIWQPSISIDKYAYCQKIAKEDARWGDLVFSNTGEITVHGIRHETVDFLRGTKVPQGIDHVGLYVGNDAVLHISHNTTKVLTQALKESVDFPGNLLYGRLVDVDEKRFFVAVPPERLDIRIKEDLIEEVARMKGLASIPSVLPALSRTGRPHKRLYYETKIKNILYARGYSEIMTYSFGDVGEVEIIKGAAMDKEKLRSDLGTGLAKAFHLNMMNAPLLELDTVRMFEFGNVFTKGEEQRNFALIVDDGKKKTSFSEEVDLLLSEIKRELGLGSLECQTISAKPYCVELDFDTLIETLPEPATYEPLAQDLSPVSYAPVPPYPFIVRDIAVWVPASVSWEDIRALALQIDSPLIARLYCFDTFEKEIDGVKKVSFAFRFVLQSDERTLTDQEANEIAEKMYSLLKEKGYEVR